MKKIFLTLALLLLVNLATAATLHGQIYNLDLEPETDVLVDINTVPQQQFLAKEGSYSFEVPEGNYTLEARKGELIAQEQIKVEKPGDFVLDILLIPGFEEEELLWQETGTLETPLSEKTGFWTKYPLWSYLIALGIILIALGRIFLAKKRYKKPKTTEPKEELKAEENYEPAYLEETLEILKKHEGRISQKELRKEMMHLSEAKISLILTELEHKGQIEKIKKGRGNVIILKAK